MTPPSSSDDAAASHQAVAEEEAAFVTSFELLAQERPERAILVLSESLTALRERLVTLERDGSRHQRWLQKHEGQLAKREVGGQ